MESNVQLVKSVLKYTFGLVPIIAGFDKFTNILTDWSQYVSEGFTGMLPFETNTFMMIVGVIEIVAGVLVLTKTRIGAYIVSAWLVAIAFILLLGGDFIDVAIRDLVMAIAAFCLAKLSEDSFTKATS